MELTTARLDPPRGVIYNMFDNGLFMQIKRRGRGDFIGGNPNNYMYVNRLFLQHIPDAMLLAVSFLFLCATRSSQTTRRH